MPGPGYCIYCYTDSEPKADLRREHIIAHKLGGRLVLHNASCQNCEKKINKEIEMPSLKFMWAGLRMQLDLPTSSSNKNVKYGRWTDNGEDLPSDLGELGFRFDEVSGANHPLVISLPVFDTPGVLWGREAEEDYFRVCGLSTYIEPDAFSLREKIGERGGFFAPIVPNVMGRMLAKIAHGIAIAELGDDFLPLLPEIILGKSNKFQYYIGSSISKSRRKSKLHEASLTIKRNFIVVRVQLFARYGLRPYEVVVGRPRRLRTIMHLHKAFSR